MLAGFFDAVLHLAHHRVLIWPKPVKVLSPGIILLHTGALQQYSFK